MVYHVVEQASSIGNEDGSSQLISVPARRHNFKFLFECLHVRFEGSKYLSRNGAEGVLEPLTTNESRHNWFKRLPGIEGDN